MTIIQFPDPRDSSTEDGMIALGGDLDPESLILAYSQGIFPWPIAGLPLAWFCPPERAILEWNRLHTPRSLTRFKNRKIFHFTINQAFKEVIRNSASAPRPGQEGTWINPEMIQAYLRLHEMGHAHSIEVWREARLVGGVYGVFIQGIFSGESMFHIEPNASRLAILFLMEHLRSRGLQWMDIQVMTPHMGALGARLIPRDEFLNLLRDTQIASKDRLFLN